MGRRRKTEGTLRRPSRSGQLSRPSIRTTTIVTAIMFACSYGAAFGAIQHFARIVPGLRNCRADAGRSDGEMVAAVQFHQEIGGLVGRVILAFLAIRIASRRNLLRVFQVPGLIIVPLVFYFTATSMISKPLKWAFSSPDC